MSPSAAHLDAINSVIFDIDEHSNTGMGEPVSAHHAHHHHAGMLEADDVNALANNLKKEVIFEPGGPSSQAQPMMDEDLMMMMGDLQQDMASAVADESDDYDSDEDTDEDSDDDDDSDEDTDEDEFDRIDLDSKEQLNGLINQGYSLGNSRGPLLSPNWLASARGNFKYVSLSF